tara:strand:- start:8832 stop:9971 length:1140 start_codon:yes stop_codon:yes gene_type:complete
MSDKISKTRKIANAVNPNGPGGKFFLSTDSDAILFGNKNNTSLKLGTINVGTDGDRTHFTRTSRNLLFPLNNRPDSDHFNRFSSTNLPSARPFQDAIIGSDSDNSLTTFKGNFFLGEDIGGYLLDDFTNRHRKYPLDSDMIFGHGTGSQAIAYLEGRKISRFKTRGGIMFGRKHGGQTMNIARVSGENTPLQFGYPKTAGNVHDSENTVFTSFGTLDLQGRTLFKSTDVNLGFLGHDSDSDNGFAFEYNSSGNTGSSKTMSAQNEQSMSSFIQGKQVGHKSYVNMTGATLTGTGTFKFAPIHNSSGTIVRNSSLSVSDIRDSDGTLTANHSGSGHNIMTVDSDGFTIGSTNVSIPSKYNLTIINAAGSTVATIKFIDPS